MFPISTPFPAWLIPTAFRKYAPERMLKKLLSAIRSNSVLTSGGRWGRTVSDAGDQAESPESSLPNGQKRISSLLRERSEEAKRKVHAPLDRTNQRKGALETKELGILSRVRLWINSERYEIPMLPTTNLRLAELASNPTAEIGNMVRLISTDPVLSGQLLKMANSVVFSGQAQAVTLHEAIMRIGTRGLRSLVYTASVHGVIMRSKALGRYAVEVWRQAASTGAIARAVGPRIGIEAERAFLIGLLHDIGKVVLLSILGRASKSPSEITPSVVGHLFYRYHQEVGGKVAVAWNLPEEIVSIAGCHHEFMENTAYPGSAAFALFCHQVDMALLEEDGARLDHLPRHPMMRAMGVDPVRAHDLLKVAIEAFYKQHPELVDSGGEDEDGGAGADAAAQVA